MRHSSDIGLYGFSMALNIDSLHNLGILFSVKHLLSISSSQLCKVGPIYISNKSAKKIVIIIIIYLQLI